MSSKGSDLGAIPLVIFFLLFIIVYVIRFIQEDIENINIALANGWSWALVVLFCCIVAGFSYYQTKRKVKKLNLELAKSSSEISHLNYEVSRLKECIASKDLFYNSMTKLGDISVKHLTDLVSDFKLVQYDISERFLRTKKHPAFSEALRIVDLKKETKLYHEQYKQMLYKYEALLGLFPELSTYVEDFESIKELNDFKNLDNLQNNYDRVRDYISKEEYRDLDIDKKNQLALDRYIAGKKNKWQIGRDYEMYIAYLYRLKGWKVEQYGIEKRLEDMGRDLIIYGQNKILIVQCKYWSETKLIHEKHIAQLYGSTVEYSLSNITKYDKISVEPIFITNINLSENAQRFAKTLGVAVHKFELGNFPRIKCNINNNEKIYHLPFDQQYDRTKIENTGEFYAFSVKEAVNAGFRRAFRFYGNS